MDKFSFKSKLYIGIVVAIILVMTMSALFYYTNVKERESEAWITHSIEVKSKLQEINTKLGDKAKINRAKRRYKDVDNLFQGNTNINVAASVNDLKSLVQDNKVQSANAVHLENQIRRVFDLWQSINLNEMRNDDVKEEACFREEMKIMDAIKVSIDAMDAHENMLLSQRRATNAESMATNNAVTILGSVLILAVVLGLGYNSTSEFRKRNKVELSLKDKMDEQARLSAQITLNNDVLQGVQEIANASQKNADVESFLQTTLDGILEFTGMASGIVYLASENDPDQLMPIASRGIASGNMKETRLDRLLAHQTDRSKPILYVENIPADFWHLSSATGSMLPGSLVYIFVKFKDQLICLLELASFHSPDEKERAFLEMFPEAIGIRLAALQVTESRDQLMQELQLKQEILLNQQEELQQSNEELLHQTSILQASEEELKVQEEELKQINAELEEKHDALELAKQAIDLKAAELEQSTKYKSEFLANMSHELRTPLNSILILANLLGDNKNNNLTAKQVEYAKIIGNSGSDLLKLINDILDLSKIEAGKIDLTIEQVAVSSIVKHMKETFDVMAEIKKIRFNVDVDPGAATMINTDIQRLEQILKNLLSNAVKFTPEGGNVSLSIEMANTNAIAFKVSDSGIGIDPSKLELIFEAFKQEDGSTNRKYGGTGLGLSISKELARMLKGTLTVESKLKEGSTFRLLLPLMIAEESGARPAMQQKAAQFAETNNEYPGTGKTILIVEDDPVFSNILQNYAEEKSYKTLIASNGQEGLEMAKRHKPDAIILDLQMPVMDGWEVLKELRVDPDLRSIPVHVISAMDEDKAPVNGIVEYVRKPVTIEELEQTFDHIGSYIAAVKHRLLIWSTDNTNDSTLDQLLVNLPDDVQFDKVSAINELIELGKQHHYDCILADISISEEHFDDLQKIRENNLFEGTSLILLIGQEISANDEMRLRKISEAIVMKSKEAHKRLKDELEIFMFHVNGHKPKEPSSKKDHLADNNILDGKKVLVADDDMRNVFALVGLLENHKMEVFTASNGLEVLEVLKKENKMDIVLMDIMMPEMDGYEAMRNIRSNRKYSDLPIIALTAKAMSNDRELCIEAGASDYMSKPINAQKLLSLMRIWLS